MYEKDAVGAAAQDGGQIPHEVAAGIKSAQNYYATQAQTDRLGGCGQKERMPISVVLRRKRLSTTANLQRVSRMIDILDRHPEFEELIELQERLRADENPY